MKGFTFIEIMVTTAIAIFLFTGVISAYNTFTETSRLRQAALNIKSDLRIAQNKAIAGEKPLNLKDLGLTCDQLLGYQLSFSNIFQPDGSYRGRYTVQAKCNPDQPQASVTTTDLPSGISFGPAAVPGPILFQVLTQGVDSDSDITIALKGGSKSYTITVTPQGTIIDNGIQ